MEWARRVHDRQSKRNPHEWEAAKQRIESAREHERQSRKCKAAKNHAIRSRALAAEGLRQMSAVPASEHLAVQTRWLSAQQCSSRFASARWDAFSGEAPAVAEPQLLIDEDEDDAMAEAADLMGAGDVNALTALGNEGLQEDVPRTAGTGWSTRSSDFRRFSSLDSLLLERCGIMYRFVTSLRAKYVVVLTAIVFD